MVFERAYWFTLPGVPSIVKLSSPLSTHRSALWPAPTVVSFLGIPTTPSIFPLRSSSVWFNGVFRSWVRIWIFGCHSLTIVSQSFTSLCFLFFLSFSINFYFLQGYLFEFEFDRYYLLYILVLFFEFKFARYLYLYGFVLFFEFEFTRDCSSLFSFLVYYNPPFLPISSY